MNQTNIIIPKKIINLNPLFWPGQGSVVVKNSNPNIFIGTGITTPTQLSKNMPFDALGFLLSAEFIKRRIPNSHVFLFVADQHAWLVNQFSKNKCQLVAQLQLKIFTQIIKSLNLINWHIFPASRLFPDAQSNSYENLEFRDVNHFVIHHQVCVKIGWKFNTSNNHKTDEVHFDQNSVKNVNFILTKPGITLNPQKPHESPYICTDQTTRIILDAQENASQKLKAATEKVSENQLRATKNHLRHICFLFENLIRPFPPKTPLENKVQAIINQIFKLST